MMDTAVVQNFSVEEFKKYPDLIHNLINKGQDFSLVLEKKGDRIVVGYKKVYDEEVYEILKESKEELAQESKLLDQKKERESFLALRDRILNQYFEAE